MTKTSNPGTVKKKNKKSGPDAVAMKQKAPKPNPFETIWSRRKFDILGKKRKGEERRIGFTRSAAIEKRKKTLLKEYKQSGKSSVFKDNRIGEQNDEIGEYQKAILRSQRERQSKLSKKRKYNLSDGEEDEFDMQGFGPFPEKDDFDEEILLEDDGDDAEAAENDKNSIISKQVNAYNSQNSWETSLMEGGENKHKSKKEVMEEIIAKSKFFKVEKAKHKEENEQLMDELDKNFTSLVQSKALLSLTQPSKMNALKALVNKSVPNEYLKKDELSATRSVESINQEKPDSYDKLVKEMALEMRARPSERTKTPEEIAQEEKEQLEQLEEERQKRMLPADDSGDEDNSDEENDVPKDVKASTRKIRSISGDDLGDSFSLDEEQRPKKGWIDEIYEREDAENLGSEEEEEEADDDDGVGGEGEEEDNDGPENTMSPKDWEQSDDDNLSIDLEEEEDGEQRHDYDDEEMELKDHKKKNIVDAEVKKDSSKAKKVKADGKQPSNQQDTLPYVIEAPKTYEEFVELVENRSNDDIVKAIKYIRTYNAIRVNEGNRRKMQGFFGILLQYFAVLATKRPLNFELLNLLIEPLMEMSNEIQYFAAICARHRISKTRTQFCEAIKNPEKSCWPSLKTLLLLRLWSLIYPCSDFRHVVMTPAFLLMCEYLMRCPIVSGRDIAIGTFLCSMVLSVTKQSRKFCPEAIKFLRGLLVAATNKKPESHQDSQYYYLMEVKSVRPLLCMEERVNEIIPLDFFKIMDLPDDSSFFNSDSFKASLMVAAVETLGGFANIYEELSSFPEIFLPISALLNEVSSQEKIPNALKDKLKDVAQRIEEKANEVQMTRRPLKLRVEKPVPIRSLVPKFEPTGFVQGRDYDPNHERAERKRIKRLVKYEKKGAIRELRKDNHFIFQVKENEKTKREQERAEKYGQHMSFLQEQEHAAKSGQLGKGGKKRRK